LCCAGPALDRQLGSRNYSDEADLFFSAHQLRTAPLKPVCFQSVGVHRTAALGTRRVRPATDIPPCLLVKSFIFNSLSVAPYLPLPTAKELLSPAHFGRTHMETMLGFAGVVVITMLALFAALALQTALLQLTIRMMQPATADRRPARIAVARGPRIVTRALEMQR
jgi:hypothetical protein